MNRVVDTASEIIVGKSEAIRLAVACLMARGHLLIEDVPGVGKTMLAHVLAKLFGLSFARVQFTSDMLPADILGISVYDRASGAFEFHPGPVFAQLVLADEVNRATPKAQSALLEAMEERQVTQDGQTRQLPEPFFVVATENPLNQIGTFPLPESQLDRFLMRIELGYPHRQAERELLSGRDRREWLAELQPVASANALLAAQSQVPGVHVSEALLDYLQALIAQSRNSPSYATGLSPRAGLAMVRAARAWALLAGRDHALPEDVQAVLPAVVGHRLRPQGAAAAGDQSPSAAAAALLEQVPVAP
ncbi:MAG: AAA family ATPase [Gammaproteobacteria bacterium]